MFNGYDIIVGVIVLFFCLIGYRMGGVSCVFYLLSGYIGLFVAKKYSFQLAMNFYLVLVLVTIAMIIAGTIVGKIMQENLLGKFDNFLGLALGAVLGITLISVAMFPVFNSLSWQNQVYVINSYSGGHVIPWVQKALPPMKDVSLKKLEQIIEKEKVIAETASKTNIAYAVKNKKKKQGE